MKPITQQSATELAAAIQAKKLSAVDLVSACIKQIEAVNPRINAVVQFNPERALAEAKEKDTLVANNQSTGPLHGIPFTLKDVYNTKGDLVTAGCLGLKDNVATNDATIVTRLKQAGAILLGKTNTPELENAADTDNLVYGKTLNPHNTDYSAGGSCGGGAAIVAAGGSVFDVGADTGGSLRVPAHYCGIATIRPTMRRIPTSGVVYGLRTGIGGAFTTEGPLARSVEDLPLLLSILQGPDGIDPNTIAAPLGRMSDVSLATLNIAYLTENTVVDTSSATKSAIKNACNALTDAEAKVVSDRPENFDEGSLLFQQLLGANGSQGFRDALNFMQVPQASSLLEKIIAHLEPFACDLPTFMQRWDAWEHYRSRVLQFFGKYDALILPVTPDSALPQDKPMWDPERICQASYTWTVSATLLPTVVVRVGTSDAGLPIGVQVVCRPFEEHIGLAVGREIEERCSAE